MGIQDTLITGKHRLMSERWLRHLCASTMRTTKMGLQERGGRLNGRLRGCRSLNKVYTKVTVAVPFRQIRRQIARSIDSVHQNRGV